MKTIEAAPANEFLRAIISDFHKYQSLGDKTFDQLSEADFYTTLYEGGNSIAILIQHINGNLISRFTDFLTTDGEKDTRNRDDEFMHHNYTKEDLIEMWNNGYSILFKTLEDLSESDLSAIIYIRHEPMSVPEALSRSLAHIAYHIGQIVFLAKVIKKGQWQTLSIAKGKSKEFNEQKIKEVEEEYNEL